MNSNRLLEAKRRPSLPEDILVFCLALDIDSTGIVNEDVETIACLDVYYSISVSVCVCVCCVRGYLYKAKYTAPNKWKINFHLLFQ